MIVTNTIAYHSPRGARRVRVSIATIATPSRAEPTRRHGASMYSGVASNPTTTDRSSRSRSHRASQAAFRNAQARRGCCRGGRLSASARRMSSPKRDAISGPIDRTVDAVVHGLHEHGA